MNIFKNVLLAHLVLYACYSFGQHIDKSLGNWTWDEKGLPLFNYTGTFPYLAYDKTGQKINQSYDPFTIIGNYRLTVLTHVSGRYQLMTGERAWGKLNASDTTMLGENNAYIQINKKKYALVGPGSLAIHSESYKVAFGTGFVSYTYQLPEGIVCQRTLSVLPSEKPNRGIPAIRLQIKIKNNSKKAITLRYNEGIRANYEMPYQQRSPKKVDYSAAISKNDSYINAVFSAGPRVPFLWENRDSPAEYDGYPPMLYFRLLKIKADYTSTKDVKGYPTIGFEKEIKLASGQTEIIDAAVGLSFNNATSASDSLFLFPADPTFRAAWKSKLPSFAEVPEDTLRKELLWSAYQLEAMATYNDYFKETKIPLGAGYVYHWGRGVCMRDHLQLLLPAFYYNRDFAKSGLRYMAKTMTPRGELYQDEIGYGKVSHQMFQPSDNQIYFLWVMSEWMRITEDYSFLNETLDFYPVGSGAKGTFIDRIALAFIYLRDEIGTGPHGLVRNLNSDWSDDIHFVLNTAAFNRNYEKSESMTNSTMVLSFIDVLIDQLLKAKNQESLVLQSERINSLVGGLSAYKKSLLLAVNNAWEGRNFLQAYYLVNLDLGKNDLFLLPNALALQIPDISKDKKIALAIEIEKRVLAGEKLGARNREIPQTDGNHYAAPGSGENGGFWWVPNSHFILGLSTFDKSRAMQMYKKMSLANYSRSYPDKWIGYWTASDYVHSSISSSEGSTNNQPVCSLYPAFKLYLYFRLKE